MDLTAETQEKLLKIIHEGYSTVEKYLFLIINKRVKISPQNHGFLTNPQRIKFFEDNIPGQVVAMVYNFVGEPSGDVFLFLDQAGSEGIINYLDDVQGVSSRITISDRESLIEIGGILLNSFLSTFGDSILFTKGFVKPRLILNPGKKIVNEIKNNPVQCESLVSEFNFDLNTGQVLGHGTIFIGSCSLFDGFSNL